MTTSPTQSREEKYLAEIDSDLADLKGKISVEEEKIKPLRDEYDSLMDLRNRVAGTTRRPGRRPSASSNSSGNRARQGSRKEQFLALVKAHPEGVTITEAAEHIFGDKERANYLYRIRTQLASDGAIRIDDGKVFPAESVSAA